MKSDLKVVERLVDNIVSKVHPLKIILFGSAVHGKINPNSDIDVLVVMPEGTHRRHTAQLLYRQITGLGTPFDVIVATPKDLREYKDNIGLIYHAVLKEGKEIYAS